MELTEKQIHTDWITASQQHPEGCKILTSGTRTDMDENGELIATFNKPKNHQGEHDSNLQLTSDGQSVIFSGNPARWNKPDNAHGHNLDKSKYFINVMCQKSELPYFKDGNVQLLSDETASYNGAKISRIDMTTNINTGSALNRDAYLRHIQTQEFPYLEKHLFGKNIYYGKESDSRTIRIYDKAKQLKDVVLPKTDSPEYIQKLINHYEGNGVIRYEVEYKTRYLKSINARFWHEATHKKLSEQFKKDIHSMTKQIETPDYDDIPTHVLGTLLMYQQGIDVKEKLGRSTYYKHRKVLKTYGYDISNKNIHLLKQKVKIITLSPCEIPDFYKQNDLLEA